VHFIGLRLATPAAQSVGLGPPPHDPARLRWFCRHRAGRCASSPERCRTAFASAVAWARPPFTSAYLIDAGASLGRSQPFDFCNEFSKYDTRARLHERRPRPPQGDALRTLPRTMRFSRCPRLPLWMQRRPGLDAPQRATRHFPDARPREPSPEGPRAFAPTSDTFQVGPQDMGRA